MPWRDRLPRPEPAGSSARAADARGLSRVRSAVRSSAMRVHSRSSMTSGSTGSRCRKKRRSVRNASEHAGVATVVLGAGGRKTVPEAVKLLGVERMNDEAVLRQGLDHRSVRNFDGNADDIRGRPGLGEKPRRHLGEPRPCVREGALATHAPLTVDDADLVSFRSPVDTDKPFDHVHRAPSRLVRARAAAMLAKPCTGARRRELPTGHPSRPTIGARVPPRCSRRRGRTVAPDRLAHSARNGRRPDDGSGDHGTDCALRLPLRATRSGPTGGRVPASREYRMGEQGGRFSSRANV